MSHASRRCDSSSSDHPLTQVIDRLAHVLPAQGPISIFIHHNTLHAFEDLPFEQAVERAADELGREPFLSASRYRDKLASGRILAEDVEAIVREHLGANGASDVAGLGSRRDLWRAVVLHGVPAARGHELSWLLDETSVLSRFRTDLPAQARAAFAVLRESDDRSYRDERVAVRQLWRACLDAVTRSAAVPPPATKAPIRHRDYLQTVHGIDIDAWVHPSLIRFLAGYLDQGLVHRPMPDRALGIHGCFLELYRSRLATHCGPWAHTLPELVADDHACRRDAIHSIEHSLARLGIAADEWRDYLRAELLALRGWAGMVRQLEERPDRVPAQDLTVTLRGYLAVRLLFERAALDEALRQIGRPGRLWDLRSHLRPHLPGTAPPSAI